MRVLLISDVYFPRVNGVATSIRTLVHELQQAGHEITLIAPEYPREGPAHGHDWIHRIRSWRVPFDPEDRIMLPREIELLTPTLRDRDFDLVHIHTPFAAHQAGIPLARRLGIPAVATYHTYFEQYLGHYIPLAPDSVLRLLARSLTRWQCNAVDTVIVPTRVFREVLERYGVRTPTVVIPTGIEPVRFEPGDREVFLKRYGLDSTRPMLLYVGRLCYEKNIDFLFQVMCEIQEQIPDSLLIVTGEGPAERRFHKLTESLGLARNVLFLGYIRNPRELNDCYAAADVFVFASRTETQGLVPLEAMAQGTPVVSTAVMGTQEILAHGHGALIAQEDVDDFADKVVELLDDDALRRRLSERALEHARSWSAAALAKVMADLYTEVVARHGDATALSPSPEL